MFCDFTQAGEAYRCRRCGFQMPAIVPLPVWRNCSRPGLGDRVAAVLGRLGVTPARVQRVTRRPCRCGQRQQRLNELGKKIGL